MNKQILELYKNPQNFGLIENPTHENTQVNSTCGDELTIQLKVKDNIVRDAKFQGSGCMISMVSASLLTNKIKKMDTEDIQKLNKQDILELIKVELNPSRVKCALLSLDAIKNSLKNNLLEKD